LKTEPILDRIWL